MYHEHYNTDKTGKIGLVVQSHYYYPQDPKKQEDIEAADRIIQFWVNFLFRSHYCTTYCYIEININAPSERSLANTLIQYLVRQEAIQK